MPGANSEQTKNKAATIAEARRVWLAGLKVGDTVEFLPVPNSKPQIVTIRRIDGFVIWLSNGRYYGAHNGAIKSGTIRPKGGKYGA